MLAYIDKAGRLAVPAALARALGWHKLTGGHMTVDLNDEGRLQICPAAELAAPLEELRAKLASEAQEADDDEILRAFEDRYRAAAFYRRGYRVKLTAETLAFLLEGPSGRRTAVYVELSGKGLGVLSREARHRRLQEESGRLSID